jgi:hypothetical protein
MEMRTGGVLVTALVVAGCGGTDGVSSEPFELIGRDWTVAPGTETYKCIGIYADRDMYIHEFQTDNPTGEHHTVITTSDAPGGLNNTQLGEHDCDVSTLDLQMLFASGVGTDSLTLPEGVALPIKKGQFIHLNLHLFNTSDAPISSHSGVMASVIDPVDADHQAEMIFTGTFNINIPPGQTVTVGGGCTAAKDSTVFAYWPHMHQYATHQKLSLTRAGTSMMLHDAAFDFREQVNYPLAPTLNIKAGDVLRTECTYTNTSSTTLTWGDSSTAEMCFTGLYRYPKTALSLFECTEGAR